MSLTACPDGNVSVKLCRPRIINLHEVRVVRASNFDARVPVDFKARAVTDPIPTETSPDTVKLPVMIRLSSIVTSSFGRGAFINSVITSGDVNSDDTLIDGAPRTPVNTG